MKKRYGFASIELPIVLCLFGLLLFAVAATTRRISVVLATSLAITGIIFCLPLLILIIIELFSSVLSLFSRK